MNLPEIIVFLEFDLDQLHFTEVEYFGFILDSTSIPADAILRDSGTIHMSSRCLFQDIRMQFVLIFTILIHFI
jgi:hypothetical protein